MAWVPLSEEQLHRVFLAIILGGAVALAWVAASMAGVPAMAGQQLAAVAADAGFECAGSMCAGSRTSTN